MPKQSACGSHTSKEGQMILLYRAYVLLAIIVIGLITAAAVLIAINLYEWIIGKIEERRLRKQLEEWVDRLPDRKEEEFYYGEERRTEDDG